MQRITDPSAATTLPAVTSTGTPGFFANSNPTLGVEATIVTEDWANGVQEELIAVITAAGLTPSITNNAQLLTAIQNLVGHGQLLNVQIFKASGTYTPTPGTNSLDVFVYGAGAAAGGSPATSSGSTSAGGGGGAGAFSYLRQSTGVSSKTVTVGAGGTGVSGSAGGSGGSSSFGSLAMAPGGSGGGIAGPSGTTTTFLAPGGAGGVVGTGTIAVPGSLGSSTILLAGTGVALPAAVGNFLAGYGAGSPGNANSGVAAAQTGVSGQPGIVIIREYA